MKFAWYFAFMMLLVGCSEEPENENPVDQLENDTSTSVMTEEDIIRHIEAQLKIPATENYSYKIYEADLNTGDVKDKIITVNLKERAINEAIASDKVAKRAAVGYMGNFNYFFYHDGERNVITSPIAVPSSPLAPLEVSFEHIRSGAHKDIQIDFRIGDSKFRQYYTIEQNAPFQICQTELYTDVSTDKGQGYYIVLEDGISTMAKNIVVYKANYTKIETEDPDKIYEVEPELTPTEELVRRWYFSPQHLKYYLKKNEI